MSEANAIGTTYLRAQTLVEPIRSSSLDLLVRYTRSAVRVSNQVPGSDDADDARTQELAAAIERLADALAPSIERPARREPPGSVSGSPEE